LSTSLTSSPGLSWLSLRRCRASSTMLSVASRPPCSSPAARIAGVAAPRGF
jgi:hypothetical protein